MAGIYVHIPFCKSKCTYCDFASYPGEIGKTESYFACLYRETEGRGREYSDRTFDTIYFGGGTPSIVDAKFILGELTNTRKFFNLSKNHEINIEINPGTIDEEKVKENSEENQRDKRLDALLQHFERNAAEFENRQCKHS